MLECSLIKRHMPKYNILLKDDKGYPYLRVDLREDYPTHARWSAASPSDGASYFGPFGGRCMTQQRHRHAAAARSRLPVLREAVSRAIWARTGPA